MNEQKQVADALEGLEQQAEGLPDFEKALEAVYLLIPKIICRRKCHAACGLIPMTHLEASRLPLVPNKTCLDIGDKVYALRNADKPEKLGKVNRTRPHTRNNQACPLLSDISRTCTAYENRPAICRLWGVVEGLRCTHGCQPERILTDEQAKTILMEINRISLAWQMSQEAAPEGDND